MLKILGWLGWKSTTFTTGSIFGLINARYCRNNVMSCRWWVKYQPKHVDLKPELNKLYSVASCWIIIPILYDAGSIEHTFLLLPYSRTWQSRRHAHTAALNIAFFLFLRRLQTAYNFLPQNPINYNIFMSTEIVICNGHYSVLRYCALNLEKQYWKLNYVTL